MAIKLARINSMEKNTLPISDSRGFTLIEIMIAIAIFGVISTAIYATYHSQQKAYIVQEKVVEMQQNIRAAMFFMEQDIRKIGYDPLEIADAAKDSNGIGKIAELRFAYDEDGDGTIQDDEYIRYALKHMGGGSIEDDGLAGSTRCCLARETGIGASASGLQPVAENVEALEFVYHFNDGTTDTACASQSDRENVRSIDVSILVRSNTIIQGFKDSKKYYPASNPTRSDSETIWGPFNDSYQRRLMTSNIKCRNMGLGG